MKGFEKFIEKITNEWNARIVARLIIFVLPGIFLVLLGFFGYGFYITGCQGRSFSGFGFEYGEDPLNSRFVDATCDVRIEDALAQITSSETQTPDEFVVDEPQIMAQVSATFEPPSPTEENLSEEENLLEPNINSQPWDFKDGCIWSDWAPMAPIHLENNIKDVFKENEDGDIDCDGWAAGAFGYEAIKDTGLLIYKHEYRADNGPLVFGMHRFVPDNLSEIYLEFNWDQFARDTRNKNELFFKIGFIDSNSDLSTGSFLKFYLAPKVDWPNLLRVDGSSDENFIEASSYSDPRNIVIHCTFEDRLKAKCNFIIDGDPDKHISKTITLPGKWDSLYLGTQIPLGATIELTVTDLVVKESGE